MNRPESGAVAGGHVLVESLDGIRSGHLSVLLVHVVCTRSGVVSDPDAEVLDAEGVLLGDLIQMLIPIVFLVQILLSWRTLFKLTISPLAFLTFFNLVRKYQKRDLATTSLGAKIRMRYSLGVGLASLGRWRPMTWYS